MKAKKTSVKNPVDQAADQKKTKPSFWDDYCQKNPKEPACKLYDL